MALLCILTIFLMQVIFSFFLSVKKIERLVICHWMIITLIYSVFILFRK